MRTGRKRPRPIARVAMFTIACPLVATNMFAQTAPVLAHRLQDNSPVERARAACDARKLGDDARPLIADLVAMLPDDAVVPGDVCGDWGRWSAERGVPPATPGEKAAAALVAIGSAAYEPVVRALRAPQWHARKNAARALGAMDDRRAVEPLVGALRDPEAAVRRNAAWALGAIDDERAVRPLLSVLQDTDADARSQAAWALGALDSAGAVPGLIGVLGDGDARVRSQAAWALGAIDDERAVPDLSRAVRSDADPKVRSQAAWALGAIGDGRASPALVAALKDSDVNVRCQAAWALGAIQH